MILLDTTAAAKISPTSAAFAQVQATHLAGDPYGLAASVLNELLYGLEKQRGNAGWDAQRLFLLRMIRDGILIVLPFDGRAARVAARLRAVRPLPPSNTSSKTSIRSKPDSRVAWVSDQQTAAISYAHGADLASDDGHHQVIAGDLIAFAGAAHAVQPAPW